VLTPLEEIRALITTHADRSAPPAVDGLRLYLERAPSHPVALLFRPTLYLVFQGAKQLLLDDRTVSYGAGDLVTSSIDLPATVQVTEATDDAPYLAVELAVDRDLLAGLATEMPPLSSPPDETVTVRPLPESVLDPVLRLLRLLDEPAAAGVLARGVQREIFYRVLAVPDGGALLHLVRTDSALARIGHLTRWMHEHLDTPVDVARLAARAAMSTATFHRHFKAATGTSPINYHKQLRLHEARRLIAIDDDSVSRIAAAVGYASPSQFSRDYKRVFGTSPALDTVRFDPRTT
jgi:AraC-like DNA-binding protein